MGWYLFYGSVKCSRIESSETERSRVFFSFNSISLDFIIFLVFLTYRDYVITNIVHRTPPVFQTNEMKKKSNTRIQAHTSTDSIHMNIEHVHTVVRSLIAKREKQHQQLISIWWSKMCRGIECVCVRDILRLSVPTREYSTRILEHGDCRVSMCVIACIRYCMRE